MVRIIPMAALLVLAACSQGETATARAPAAAVPAEAGAAARHPVSGLRVIDLAVRGAAVHRFRVELADTAEAQSRGLMFRNELGDFEGMIFPSAVPEPRSFWMKNTPLSLDIIFVGPDGRIINIAANTTPYSLDSVSSTGLASAVLELRAGRSAALGIKPGDKVEYTLP
jgi:uncharacterized membrane protein (UPF0127 family)